MDWVGHPLFRKIILLLVFVMTINILVLDAYVLVKLLGTKQAPSTVSPESPGTRRDREPSSVTVDSCPTSCLDTIRTATLSASQIATPTQTKSTKPETAKDYYVPLGSSLFYSVNEWADVPGLETYIDTNNFTRIKKVVFEASLHVPNGNEDAWVRLYNATDDHPVWYSELFFPTDTTTNYQVSPPITLDAGNKLYKVQMKTQFKMSASLDQTRIHIVVEE